jgi:two-component system osmolarity sensor histidine kinase EnvZ
MKQSGRSILWGVFFLQFMVLILALELVALPLAKRSASDLAGLMLISAKVWEDLTPDKRDAFVQKLYLDTGLQLERGPLPPTPPTWKPHWYADWVEVSLKTQGVIPSQVNMQKEMVEVLLLIDGEPIILRAVSPSLGKVFALFLGFSLLAIMGTLLALWWQKRWQLQQWRHQLVLSGLAHDFRTPLTRLKLHLALLPNLSAEQSQQMNQQVDALSEMVDTTLMLATQQHRQGQYKPLSTIWQSWQLAYPDVLFTADETLLVQSVSHLLGRIGQNVMDNALVHGQGQVRVGLARYASGWALSVTDEGKGIPDAVWQAVERNQPPPAKGVGLGLLSSRWLAEIAGIQIRKIPQGLVMVSADSV